MGYLISECQPVMVVNLAILFSNVDFHYRLTKRGG